MTRGGLSMPLFSILGGRTSFYQWDLGQRLIVNDDTCCEVHFDNGTTEKALVCRVFSENNQRLVDVPNIFLQQDKVLNAFAYVEDKEHQSTIYSETFKVVKRPKPDDYVYTETEVWTAEKAVAEALEEAKASGDFKGDKGDKGDPGVVKFVVVAELPEQDTENAIYLVPIEESAEGNLFDEYIYVDGAWEKIGSTSVAVNLDEYVKNTDYATYNKVGLVTITNTYNGLSFTGDGAIKIYPAAKSNIDGRNSSCAITPTNMDYALKVGLTTNKETLTDEEKAAACSWVGAVPTKTADRTSVYGVDAQGNQILVGTSLNAANNGMIPVYNSSGCIRAMNPGNQFDVTNKGYVDGLIAELVARIEALENK